jgi:hypothetical protein
MDDQTSGGGTTVINIDLNPLVEAIKGDGQKIFQETAMRLFANSNFEINQSKSPAQIAQEAINRAAIFTVEFNNALKST